MIVTLVVNGITTALMPIVISLAALLSSPHWSDAGQAVVIFAGGTVDQLERAAADRGASGAWYQDDAGTMRFAALDGVPDTMRLPETAVVLERRR